MESPTRWCPVCETRGIPIVWGEPSDQVMRLADEGRVVVAGCTPTGLHPSHICAACYTGFNSSDRIYQREQGGRPVLGIGVWPHGRRPVRIEDNGSGWTVVVAGRGSMLIDREASTAFIPDVLENLLPWEIEEWVHRRGSDVTIERHPDGRWDVTVQVTSHVSALLLAKAWWRTLGRRPIETALELLASHAIWMPSPR